MSLFAHADGSVTNYSYNADGIRTGKQYLDAGGGIIGTIKYTLDGNKIVAENRNGTNIYYTYDDKGAIMGMIYGGQDYIFSKNLQGDIIGIYNPSRQLVAKYTYNAYGEITAITNASGTDISNNATHIANINPFRYRGYYYDTETGFYYLQSRYYDPVVGRFLNADAFVSTGQGILGNNMFAYCNNNPVIHCDNNGKFATFAVPALSGFSFFLSLEDEIKSFVGGFFNSIDNSIKGIKDWISERSRIREQQERQAREKAQERAKFERKKAELKEGYCIIVGIYDGCPVVTRGPIKLRDAIEGVRRDFLAGLNCYIPYDCENWGIYAFKESDAESFVFHLFGAYVHHDGLIGVYPHYHSLPHFYLHNGIETNVHAWYITR